MYRALMISLHASLVRFTTVDTPDWTQGGHTPDWSKLIAKNSNSDSIAIANTNTNTSETSTAKHTSSSTSADTRRDEISELEPRSEIQYQVGNPVSGRKSSVHAACSTQYSSGVKAEPRPRSRSRSSASRRSEVKHALALVTIGQVESL
jgi:hypothetical protein